MRNFARRGQILVDAEGVNEDQLMELALDAGADDVTNEGAQFEILTDPKAYNEVSEKLTKAGYKVSEDSGVNFVPTVWAPVTDKGHAASLLKLIEAIEELEDVQNVYMNGDIADEAIEG